MGSAEEELAEGGSPDASAPEQLPKPRDDWDMSGAMQGVRISGGLSWGGGPVRLAAARTIVCN